MLSHKKVFLFDMDGLLVDTERLYLEMWEKVFQQENIDFNMDVLKMTIGVSGQLAKDIYERELGDPNYLEPYKEKEEKMMDDYLKENPLPVKKGARELLEYLKQNNYRCILVSSSNKSEISYFLGKANLDQYFKEMVRGDQVKYTKPSPEIYLKAIDKYNLNKKECVVFEDSINGIQSANDAGIDVIGIPDLVDLSSVKQPHLLSIYDSLEDVLNILKK